MTEPVVYLEKLSAFSRMLRLEGLAVGPQETADACRILIILGLEDRQQVKTALRTVYAKSREEQGVFDRVFDGFFIPEEAMRKQAEEQRRKEEEMAQARQQAKEDLQINGKPMDLDQQQQETYAAMPEEARNKLRNFMDRYRDSATRNPELYSNFIHSVFAKTLMEQQMKLEDAALDLGCTPTKAFFKVIIHDIMPGVISGFMMAFTMSLDDFVISYFVTGSSFITLPVEIYNYTKKPIHPKIYALFTLMFLTILVLMVIMNLLQGKDAERKLRKRGAKA